jgi:ligand-binding sensor domain-containing protein
VNTGLERLETHVLVHHQGSLYAGTGSGVYRSANGGTSWVSDNEGLKNLLIRALAIDTGGFMYAGTTGMGIYRKDLRHSKWVRITATQLSHPRDRLPENFVRALVADDTGDLYAGTADNGIYVSGDRGDSWRALGKGIENASIRALAIGGSSWFAGTGQGMYRSVDRGKSWVSINEGLTERSVQGFAVGKDGLVYVGTSAGIFKTGDHGAHWSPTNQGLDSTPRLLGPAH